MPIWVPWILVLSPVSKLPFGPTIHIKQNDQYFCSYTLFSQQYRLLKTVRSVSLEVATYVKENALQKV